MIVILEPHCVGFEHSDVNAALLIAVRRAFPTDKIEFFAEKSHLECVAASIPSSFRDIQFSSVSVRPKSASRWGEFAAAFSLVYGVFRHAALASCQRVLLTSITTATLLAAKLSSARFRQAHCAVIPHSILRHVRCKGVGRKSWFQRTLEVFNTHRLHYILLGRPIEKNLLARVTGLSGYTHALDMPYLYEQLPNRRLDDETTIFAFLGVARENKGLSDFLSLAREIADQKFLRSSRFEIIGHITDPSLLSGCGGYVFLPEKAGPMLRADFKRAMGRVDYSIFLYDRHDYQLTASASLFDSISLEIPIIAVRNDFFEYYFERFGDIGYLCDDYEEVKSTVLRLLSKEKDERYRIQCLNLRQAQHQLGPENFAPIIARALGCPPPS